MKRHLALFTSVLILLSVSIGCATKPALESADAQPVSHIFGSKQVTLPAGTTVTVRLGSAVGSKLSTNGDHFTASVAKPVEVEGKVVVPAGAEVLGKVVEAVPQGRFKGAAILRLVLETITVNDDSYDVKTSSVNQYLKGKGKRTAVMTGGGAALGGIIGGLAGGGKGAAIGALAGGGAGAGGAAFTGNKDIVLPTETVVSFELSQPLELR